MCTGEGACGEGVGFGLISRGSVGGKDTNNLCDCDVGMFDDCVCCRGMRRGRCGLDRCSGKEVLEGSLKFWAVVVNAFGGAGISGEPCVLEDVCGFLRFG